MKAAVLHGREDLRIDQVEVPAIGPGEMLLRTRVALTCGTDAKVFRRGYHARMIRPPAVFGHEVAGVVEEVGPGVDALAPGMAVVAANSAPCGECFYCRLGSPNLCDDLLFWNGAYAEFVRIPARVVRRNVLQLGKVGFRQGAMVEPLACVVRGIEDSGVRAGQIVVVIGAGPIGLMLARLALLRGAKVISVDRNEARLDRARTLGLETVSTLPADSAERLLRFGEGRGADVVIEAAGARETVDLALRIVRKGGLVNVFAGCPDGTEISLDLQRLHYQELTIRSNFHHTPDSVREAFRLISEGLVDPDAFITGQARLDELPAILARMARGDAGLKTAILTSGEEP